MMVNDLNEDLMFDINYEDGKNKRGKKYRLNSKFFPKKLHLNSCNDIYSKNAFNFLYCYIPFLFVFIYMKQKIMKQQNNVVSHN